MASLKQFSLFLAIFSLFLSCRKPASPNWDVDLSVPLVNADLDIKNFFGDTLVSSDETGLLHLRLNREIYALKLDSLFQLPDTSIVNSFTFQAFVPITLNPGQTFTFFPASELEFEFGTDAALKRFDVQSGALSVTFSNDLTEAMDLVYVIPNARKNGAPLTISVTIPPGQNSITQKYSLDGYQMDLRGLDGTKFNTISQAYTLSVNPNSNTVTVTYGKGAKAELTYSKIVPKYIEGYFGQQSVNIDSDTARFDIGKTFTASNFMLDQVRMDFYIKNEFGAEFRASLSDIKSINSANQNTVALQSSQLSVVNLNRASKSGAGLFPSVKPLYFNTNNSNIVPFISNLPDKLSYKGKIELNPLNPPNISGYNDFAFYDTGIRIWADVDIPLRYTADYFLLQSSGPISLGNSEQLDRVNAGYFNVIAENGFPFQARLQAYLKDENGLVLDSIFEAGQNSIPAGVLNTQNDVVSPVSSNLKISVSESKIEALKVAKTIEVKTYLLMPPGPSPINLYERYKFRIKIIAELNYLVKF
jgi:hypothetical protein